MVDDRRDDGSADTLSKTADRQAIAIRRDLAVRLARAAGAMALEAFRDSERIIVAAKEFDDVVSNMDRKIEQFLARSIIAAFPDDGILGEEGASQASAYTWIIDPIDGTTNYTRGQAHWCISIAFAIDFEPVIGVIFDPCRNELFEAVVGEGAWLDGRKLACSPRPSLDAAVIGFGYTRKLPVAATLGPLSELAAAGATFRAQGAGALTIAHIAAGRIDGFLEAVIYIWDCAAASVILTESGGQIVTGFCPDEPRQPFSLVAGCTGVFEAVRAAAVAWHI